MDAFAQNLQQNFAAQGAEVAYDDIMANVDPEMSQFFQLANNWFSVGTAEDEANKAYCANRVAAHFSSPGFPMAMESIYEVFPRLNPVAVPEMAQPAPLPPPPAAPQQQPAAGRRRAAPTPDQDTSQKIDRLLAIRYTDDQQYTWLKKNVKNMTDEQKATHRRQSKNRNQIKHRQSMRFGEKEPYRPRHAQQGDGAQAPAPPMEQAAPVEMQQAPQQQQPLPEFAGLWQQPVLPQQHLHGVVEGEGAPLPAPPLANGEQMGMFPLEGWNFLEGMQDLGFLTPGEGALGLELGAMDVDLLGMPQLEQHQPLHPWERFEEQLAAPMQDLPTVTQDDGAQEEEIDPGTGGLEEMLQASFDADLPVPVQDDEAQVVDPALTADETAEMLPPPQHRPEEQAEQQPAAPPQDLPVAAQDDAAPSPAAVLDDWEATQRELFGQDLVDLFEPLLPYTPGDATFQEFCERTGGL